MAVTRASASRSTVSFSETTKMKENKMQRNSTGIQEKEQQKRSETCSPSTPKIKEQERQRKGTTVEKKLKQESETCSSSSIKKKRKSPGIRLIGGRIYDSENGKCCHQCRQKTVSFSASCQNMTGGKKCTYHYCHICLLNRYGEKAEAAVELGCQWKCPSCRGVCNCSYCMKKRGFTPTGSLVNMAKAKGFSSVLEMLQLEEMKKQEKVEGPSMKKQKASNKEQAASTKEFRNKNGPDETINLTFRIQALERASGYENNKNKNGKYDNKTAADQMRNKKANGMPSGSKMISNNHDLHLAKNTSRALSNEQDTESDETTKGNSIRSSAAGRKVDKAQFSRKTTAEIQIQVSHPGIPLPRGTVLNRVAELDLLPEDVGHALQFLEFCEAFGEVFDLKKGQPELLLRELTGEGGSHGQHDFSVETFHIKLLSMILNDQEKGCSSLIAKGRNSWLETLENYIAKCPYSSIELIWDCSELGPNKYEELDYSKKLRILTFLCDEALGTIKLHNWIDEKSSEFLEERKIAKQMFLVKEKNEKKKLRDQVAKAMLLKNGAPLSIAEHENLVSEIKAEVTQSLAGKLEAANNKITRKHYSAVRSCPILSDATGRKFWRLRSYYGERDVLLQEVAYGDPITAKEKWCVFDLSEKANIERYISSFKET